MPFEKTALHWLTKCQRPIIMVAVRTWSPKQQVHSWFLGGPMFTRIFNISWTIQYWKWNWHKTKCWILVFEYAMQWNFSRTNQHTQISSITNGNFFFFLSYVAGATNRRHTLFCSLVFRNRKLWTIYAMNFSTPYFTRHLNIYEKLLTENVFGLCRRRKLFFSFSFVHWVR